MIVIVHVLFVFVTDVDWAVGATLPRSLSLSHTYTHIHNLCLSLSLSVLLSSLSIVVGECRIPTQPAWPQTSSSQGMCCVQGWLFSVLLAEFHLWSVVLCCSLAPSLKIPTFMVMLGAGMSLRNAPLRLVLVYDPLCPRNRWIICVCMCLLLVFLFVCVCVCVCVSLHMRGWWMTMTWPLDVCVVASPCDLQQ